jgi:multidrug resistance efflux pump
MRQKVQELERNLEQLQSKLQNSQAECLASHVAGDQLKKSLDEANRKVNFGHDLLHPPSPIF